MITSVEIENLRGIAHGTLVGLTPLTILVGPNGSGKSTVLDAVLIGAHPQPGHAIEKAGNRHPGTPNPVRWLRRDPDSDNVARIVLTDADRQVVREVQLKPDLRSGSRPKILVRTSLSENAYGVTGADHAPSPFDPVHLLGANSPSDDRPLTDLFSKLKRLGGMALTVAATQAILPGALHLEILTEPNGDSEQPVLFVAYPDRSVPAAYSGDGVHALIRLGLELAIQPGGVALVEEPEVHLHPAAIRQAARLLWDASRRGVQVILTTHDIELIDALLEEADGAPESLSVFWLKLEDGCLKSVRTAGPDAAFEREQIGKDLR